MKILASSLPNLPWVDKPARCPRPCWRHPANPIIPRDLLPTAWGIYNSAAVPFRDKFAGVFRVDDERRRMTLHSGFSEDGITWSINPEAISFATRVDAEAEFLWGYDPRVVWVEDRWYVLWCNEFHGPTIGVAWTQDFETFHQLENAFLPYNRNGVLFPRKINGRFAMLSRPSDNSHTAFGDIFYSESPDMEFWGHHRWVMGRRRGWESMKVGPGPAPIETTEGWLAFTHGVFNTCSGYVYSMGAILLDRECPWKVICRPGPFLLAPMESYEMIGTTPNVIFPCATLADADTGRIAIYYGAADTCVALAFTQIDELIPWMLENRDPVT